MRASLGLPTTGLLIATLCGFACSSAEDPTVSNGWAGNGGTTSASDGGAAGHPIAGAADVAGGDAGQGGQAASQGGQLAAPADGGAGGETGGAGATGSEGGDGEPPEDCELLYTQGHGDLFVGYDAGGLSWGIRSSFGNQGPETVVDASRVCLVIPKASYELARSVGGAPDEAPWAFLGLDAGDPFWLLPQSAQEGMPWFGASTEEVPSNVYAGNELTFAIESIEAPVGANVSAWSSTTLGEPSVIFATATGQTEHDFTVGAHVHFNWAFTQAGLYKIAFAIRGLRDGQVEASAPSFFRVQVVP